MIRLAFVTRLEEGTIQSHHPTAGFETLDRGPKRHKGSLEFVVVSAFKFLTMTEGPMSKVSSMNRKHKGQGKCTYKPSARILIFELPGVGRKELIALSVRAMNLHLGRSQGPQLLLVREYQASVGCHVNANVARLCPGLCSNVGSNLSAKPAC